MTEPDGIIEAHDLVSEPPDLELASPDESGAIPSPWRSVPSRRVAVPHRWRNPIGLVGAGIIGFTVLVALLGDQIWTLDPNSTIYAALKGPTWAHPFGTDELGRDTLARIIHGAQVSLQVSLLAVSIAFVLGTAVGLFCGYARGAPDALLMRVVDIMFAFPSLVLAIVVAGLLGPSTHERDDRHRHRLRARLRPCRPRLGARRDQRAVHRGGACGRSHQQANRVSMCSRTSLRPSSSGSHHLSRAILTRRRSASSVSARNSRRRRGGAC